jgi:hypothetical protein
MPKDAPKMTNPDPKAVATVALVSLDLHTDTDVTFAGDVSIDFTLPKEQIGGRSFAVQLYRESGKKESTRTFFGNYAKSSLAGSTLHFDLDVPAALQVKKDEHWLLVLYGNELPSASTSPSTSPSGSPSASPSGSVSPSTAPSATASASASATP